MVFIVIKEKKVLNQFLVIFIYSSLNDSYLRDNFDILSAKIFINCFLIFHQKLFNFSEMEFSLELVLNLLITEIKFIKTFN